MERPQHVPFSFLAGGFKDAIRAQIAKQPVHALVDDALRKNAHVEAEIGSDADDTILECGAPIVISDALLAVP